MNKKGIIIVMESGTDASGKTTQTMALYNRLKQERYNISKIKFPNYASDSSGPVRMYLNGELGRRADDVSAYAASALYAVDRFASYAKEWRSFYEHGGIVFADRYTTSNMVHQAAKIKDSHQRLEFLEWLKDLEYEKLGLPKPDLVFFLHVDFDIALELLKSRNMNSDEVDIHEADNEHLRSAYDTACEVAKLNNWIFIECTVDGKLRTVEEIHEEIYQHVMTVVGQ